MSTVKFNERLQGRESPGNGKAQPIGRTTLRLSAQTLMRLSECSQVIVDIDDRMIVKAAATGTHGPTPKRMFRGVSHFMLRYPLLRHMPPQ